MPSPDSRPPLAGPRHARPGRRRPAVCLLGVALLGAACGGNDIEWRTDSAAIDSAARRGDAMIEAMRADSLATALGLGDGTLSDDAVRALARAQFDSARARLLAQSDDSLARTASDSLVTVDPALASRIDQVRTQRAIALGDSLARAAAARRSAEFAEARARALGDTVRGIVVLLGAAPVEQVAVRERPDAPAVRLSGMATRAIARVAGLEVMVRGTRTTPRDLVASTFVVRAHEGTPVVDGQLTVREDGTWGLDVDGVFRAVRNLPVAAQVHVGARIWITTGGESAPQWGVIIPRG